METILPSKLTYSELSGIYSRWFSLNGIAGEIDNKFAVISLICLLTNAQKKKNPDTTCYEVIKKVTAKGGLTLPEDNLKGFAVVCEDFLKGSTSFNSCGLKTSKEMIDKINEILANWLPF